jgi:hypothetical protein
LAIIKKTIIIVEKDMEKPDALHRAGSNVKWLSYFGKHPGRSSKEL